MGDFDWDEVNIAHIRLHQVEPHEAEEALQNYSEIVNSEIRLVNIGVTQTEEY